MITLTVAVYHIEIIFTVSTSVKNTKLTWSTDFLLHQGDSCLNYSLKATSALIIPPPFACCWTKLIALTLSAYSTSPWDISLLLKEIKELLQPTHTQSQSPKETYDFTKCAHIGPPTKFPEEHDILAAPSDHMQHALRLMETRGAVMQHCVCPGILPL